MAGGHSPQATRPIPQCSLTLCSSSMTFLFLFTRLAVELRPFCFGFGWKGGLVSGS